MSNLPPVPVFLRALDYFQGILFITTNRVGVIDEAFKSRIHMQLGFSELNDDARARIWQLGFERLGRSEVQIEYAYSAKEYVKTSRDVKELCLNGREIRNGECQPQLDVRMVLLSMTQLFKQPQPSHLKKAIERTPKRGFPKIIWNKSLRCQEILENT